jgi:DNA-binding CsgD family transcriptional regulator
MVNLSIYRSRRAGAFEESDLDLVRFLRPHIQRAYRLHSELSAARNEQTSLQAALDSMTAAVILLDEGLRVITMNQAAQRLLKENDGLLLARDGLRAGQIDESARLQQLIAEASLTSAGKGLKAGGAMNISRNNRPPLHVLVSPVRRVNLDGRRSVRAIVLAADPTQRIRPAQEVMQFLFGLTPAESRVATLLADGHSSTEIAETLGVSRNTLKTQLASVYSKTGTSRQAQLVRLMLQISVHPSR